jgi:hypothetical protein
VRYIYEGIKKYDPNFQINWNQYKSFIFKVNHMKDYCA